MSPKKRWPWLVMAINLQSSSLATLIISVGGFPSASVVETVNPCSRRCPAAFSRYARSLFISSDSASLSWLKLRAAQPSATCSSSNSEPSFLASCAICGSIVSSAGLFSSATRIFLYMKILLGWHGQTKMPVKYFQNGRWHEHIKKQFYVEDNDNRRRRPAENLEPRPVCEFAHLGFFAGEAHQRPDGETELH